MTSHLWLPFLVVLLSSVGLTSVLAHLYQLHEEGYPYAPMTPFLASIYFAAMLFLGAAVFFYRVFS